MEFFRRAAGAPQTLGILPGTFNPPTRAHLALARAALGQVDEVLFVLPRELPHKTYGRVGFDQRLEMLKRATEDEPRYSIAASEHGLFIDIARECRSAYGPNARLLFLCGRDAAERIVNWDYGRPGAFPEMLEEFELLVAARQGDYQPPSELRERIHRLVLHETCDDVSATEIRERIARGKPWEDLAPASITELVKQVYSAG